MISRTKKLAVIAASAALTCTFVAGVGMLSVQASDESAAGKENLIVSDEAGMPRRGHGALRRMGQSTTARTSSEITCCVRKRPRSVITRSAQRSAVRDTQDKR